MLNVAVFPAEGWLREEKVDSFFFLISKKTNILEQGEVPSSTQEVGKRNQPNKKQKPKSYLLPNHVRKSITEFVLSSLDTLAQAHKLVTKFYLIF